VVHEGDPFKAKYAAAGESREAIDDKARYLMGGSDATGHARPH
jgi:hypothetical protein